MASPQVKIICPRGPSSSLVPVVWSSLQIIQRQLKIWAKTTRILITLQQSQPKLFSSLCIVFILSLSPQFPVGRALTLQLRTIKRYTGYAVYTQILKICSFTTLPILFIREIFDRRSRAGFLVLSSYGDHFLIFNKYDMFINKLVQACPNLSKLV